MSCNFKHDNIDRLFGVEPVAIEALPKVCTCGAPLTYASTVAFIRENGPSWDRHKGPNVASEEDAVVWESIEKAP